MLKGYPIALGFILHKESDDFTGGPTIIQFKSQWLCSHQHRKSARSQILPTTLFMPQIISVFLQKLKTAMLKTRWEVKDQIGRRILSIYSLFF